MVVITKSFLINNNYLTLFISVFFYINSPLCFTGFLGGSDGKESVYNAGDPVSSPGSGRSPWRREWLPTPVFMPGEFHGQRILVAYSPWGHSQRVRT